MTMYSYWLVSRTTAVLFDPRTDLLRLRATDAVESQTNLLLSVNPVYHWFVIHLHLFKIYFFTPSTYKYIRCFQYPYTVKSENLNDASTLWRQNNVIYWTNEILGKQSTVRSRSINRWTVDQSIEQFCNYRVFCCLQSKFCVFIVLLLYRWKKYGV